MVKGSALATVGPDRSVWMGTSFASVGDTLHPSSRGRDVSRGVLRGVGTPSCPGLPKGDTWLNKMVVPRESESTLHPEYLYTGVEGMDGGCLFLLLFYLLLGTDFED